MTERSNSHRFIARLLARLREGEWIPILLVRLSIGLLFFESGRGKIFFKLEEYFAELGIPFPQLTAVVVSSVEFFGGICLILGLATRIVAVSLASTMLVAIWTVRLNDAKTVGDFLYLPEVLLVVIFVWLVFSGPGKISIDHLLARKLGVESDEA